MNTLQFTDTEINSVLVEFADKLEGLSPNDARAVALRFLESQARDAEKKRKEERIEELRQAPVIERPIPSKAAAAANQDIHRLEMESDARARQDAKKAQRHKLGDDLWDALNDSDAKRFRDLGICTDGSRPLLATVPQKRRHAAIVALMYHVGQWAIAHGLITRETPFERVQQGIYKRVKPQQDAIATYRTKGGVTVERKDAGPIKDDSELWRLAGAVARKVVDSLKDWRDEDAARRGGIQSGIVRRDRAESTTWPQVIALAESGMPKAQIAREMEISRRMVYKILGKGIRFKGNKASGKAGGKASFR